MQLNADYSDLISELSGAGAGPVSAIMPSAGKVEVYGRSVTGRLLMMDGPGTFTDLGPLVP